MTQKSLINIQISPIKNLNFEKPSRNLSDRTKLKILTKSFFDISQKKFGSAYAQSPRKCLNIENLAKIEGKEANFFSKISEGHIRIWFRSKKNSKLSHACVPLRLPTKNVQLSGRNDELKQQPTRQFCNRRVYKGTVSRDGFGWRVLGLNRERGQFFNFLAA
jgi:hypothetical protein